MRKVMGHRGFSEGGFIRVPLVADREGAGGWLSPTLRKRLGDELRRHYRDLEAAPLPADITTRLACLDKHAAIEVEAEPSDPTASVVS